MNSKSRCHVNEWGGGGLFVCRRPVATKNGFCEFHGSKSIGDKDQGLELTWPAWFRAKFIHQPQNIYRAIRAWPRQIRFWWWTRKNPPCHFCGARSMVEEEGKRVCWDHYGP